MVRSLLIILMFLLCSGEVFAARDIQRLPDPRYTGRITLEESLAHRRSERSFQTAGLTNEQIAQLLWAAQGITERTWGFRTAPSAGGTYPLEIYLVKRDGVFHYLPLTHSLEKTKDTDCRPSLTRASLGQDFLGDAPVVIVIAADFEKTEVKFGARAQRYVHLEAGHVAENILLQAEALGLGAAPVGSFWDDVVKAVLDLPYAHDPLYLIPVGYIK
ncbi:SagB/ThcOx family dehydrogenase [Candidatus Saganbacteria bacterium]|nr:SagB/ThcOx family dehydrogenase [Candidatus Saganbacteria bacterium]